MGLMAITELELPRREFLTLGRSRKRPRGQPPRRPGEIHTALPQPPNWGPKIPRRMLIASGSAAVVVGTATLIFRPWEWFTPQPEPEIPETLESLVAQAKDMENTYTGNDLSDNKTRNNFTAILAGIYTKDAPSALTKEQIAGSVVWAKDLDEFIRLVEKNSLHQRQPKSRDYFAGTPALVTDNKKIVVNLNNLAFNASLLRRRGGFPKDWNALKSLRRVLLHEFVHLTTTTKKDDEFFALTDLPEDIEDPVLDGFVILFKERGQGMESFHPHNELAVETIANERSNRLFGPTPPIPYIEQGVNLSIAQIRFSQILDAAEINITTLERLNRSSDLYGFLATLASKVDFPSNTSLADKINYVLSVFDSVLYNNQTIIQEYIRRTQFRQR